MTQAQRRIPQQSDEGMTLVQGLTLDDAILFAPAIFLVLLSLVAIPPLFTLQSLMLAGVLFIAGLIAVYTTPPYYQSTEWVSLHLNHRLQPSEYHHTTHHFDHAEREQPDVRDYDLVTSVWATNERTQDVLDIAQVAPPNEDARAGYIEREDGTLLGAVRVTPANLTLAMGSEWRQAVDAMASVVNTLDFPIQIYRTTREFDVEGFLANYQVREGDADVRDEPVLEELLRTFLTWYPEQLRAQDTKLIEFYVVVGVPEAEVESTARTEGITDQLADWPIFRLFLGADDEEYPDVVRRARQRDTLADRIGKLTHQLTEIPGVDADRIDAAEHAAVLKRAWRQDAPVQSQMPTTGVVTRQSSDEGSAVPHCNEVNG